MADHNGVGVLHDLPELMREYAGSTIHGAVAYGR